jgi:hypothetical protein
MAERPLGYLVINVLESAGHDSEDQPVWESEFKQGYARGRLSSAPSFREKGEKERWETCLLKAT